MPSEDKLSCVCVDRSPPSDPRLRLRAFYSKLQDCAALRLFVPDSIVSAHREFSQSLPDAASHCSIPLLAYSRGSLPDLTGLIHSYLLVGNELRADVNMQYRKDLREKWVLESEPVARYRYSRMLLSRIAELSFTRWLEAHGWQILSLEARGGGYDVSAKEPSGSEVDFEIKYLAQRKVVFEINRASFLSPTAGWLDMCSPADYLLFRVFEAAKQLQLSPNRKVAVAIVKDYELSYEIPLTDNWIDWTNPGFLRKDGEMHAFLEGQYEQNPNLDLDVKQAIAGLAEVWVMQDQSAFDVQMAHQFKTRAE